MATKPFNAREISIQLERELLDDFGQTAAAVLRNLIFASPVGNPSLWQVPDSAPGGYVGGHFRRNWIVSIGGFNRTEIEGQDSAGAATFAVGREKIEELTRRGKAGANLVIQNNTPYANRLALGHSIQADAGWVDEEIDLGLAIPGGRKDLG